MKKLWKVTVNSLGWSSPKTYYAESREAAEIIGSQYPASDPVQYAGSYTESKAQALLDATAERGAW